jgi:hypothetical protein
MNKKYLKFCLYYKGEEKSPFEDYSNESIFWDFERMFIHDLCDPVIYEKMALDYIKRHPRKKNFITSSAPLEQKAMALYIEDMLMKWAPMDVKTVLEYGK